MRALIKLVLLLILFGVLGIPAIVWFALSDTALVAEPIRLSHQDIARAQAILRRNDPRHLPAGAQAYAPMGRRPINGSFYLQDHQE